MSDDPFDPDENRDHEPNPDDEGQRSGGNPAGHFGNPQSQEIRHSQVTALVPESVAAGTFSTGVVVVQGSHEFVLDFVLRIAKPQQLAARIVLPFSVVPRLIAALRENLKIYERRFGPLGERSVEPRTEQSPATENAPAWESTAANRENGIEEDPASKSPEAARPTNELSVQELYEQLKIPESQLWGTYANAVMIVHTAHEFCFDFIATFYPRSVVARRVYLSASNVPSFLNSLIHSYGQFEQKFRTMPPPGPQPHEPENDFPE